MFFDIYVVKIGGCFILDKGWSVIYFVCDVLGSLLEMKKLIIGIGGGVRICYVFFIGIDLGMFFGVLVELV